VLPLAKPPPHDEMEMKLLQDHQSNPVSTAVKQIIGILNCLISRKETDIKDLYEQGKYLCYEIQDSWWP